MEWKLRGGSTVEEVGAARDSALVVVVAEELAFTGDRMAKFLENRSRLLLSRPGAVRPVLDKLKVEDALIEVELELRLGVLGLFLCIYPESF